MIPWSPRSPSSSSISAPAGPDAERGHEIGLGLVRGLYETDAHPQREAVAVSPVVLVIIAIVRALRLGHARGEQNRRRQKTHRHPASHFIPLLPGRTHARASPPGGTSDLNLLLSCSVILARAKNDLDHFRQAFEAGGVDEAPHRHAADEPGQPVQAGRLKAGGFDEARRERVADQLDERLAPGDRLDFDTAVRLLDAGTPGRCRRAGWSRRGTIRSRHRRSRPFSFRNQPGRAADSRGSPRSAMPRPATFASRGRPAAPPSAPLAPRGPADRRLAARRLPGARLPQGHSCRRRGERRRRLRDRSAIRRRRGEWGAPGVRTSRT